MVLTDPPSYHDHPRYALRRFMILSGIMGIIFCVSSTGYDSRQAMLSYLIFTIFWLLGSVATALWDLVDWKLKMSASWARSMRTGDEREPLLLPTGDENEGTRRDDDDNPKPYRPRVFVFVLDVFLFLALGWVWGCIVIGIQDVFSWQYTRWGMVGLIELCTYASVTVGLNAVAHAICMWKELMAIKQIKWERTIRQGRMEWENRLGRMITTALQSHASRQTRERRKQCNCPCICRHGDNTNAVVLEEDKIVERLLRVLGKLPAEELDPSSSEEDQTNDHHAAHLKRHDDDLEAGPSYQREPLLTPSQSAFEVEEVVDDEAVDVTGVDPVSPIMNHVSVASESSSDTVEPVLVKKKVKRAGVGRDKEKGKEKILESDAK